MKLKIFVASPGDVSEERDIVSVVVQELKRTIGDIRDVDLETIRWETHTFPDVGDDAQDVVNNQIGEYDVFIGIMWKRFGTPTKRARSGTGEEFERAYEYFRQYKRPKIMFYFRKAPFYPESEKVLTQFRRVLRFRKKLEKLGVYFWEYQQTIDFERDVREHLIRQILELTEKPKVREKKVREKEEGPIVFMSSVREDRPTVEPVHKALRSAGFRPWLDVADLLPGEDWQMSIRQTIEKADFFLVFVSKESVSKVGYVQTEIRLVLNEISKRADQFIIPVRLDAVELPRNLIKYQWVDLFSLQSMDKLIFFLRASWNARERENTL